MPPQTRLRLAIFVTFIMTIMLLYYVEYKSCRSFEATWYAASPARAVIASCTGLRLWGVRITHRLGRPYCWLHPGLTMALCSCAA